MNSHFDGLAALRAVAALAVVVGHVELLKFRGNVPAIWGNPALFWPDGHLAVVLFFVLSGFLITHILVTEKEATGRVSFENFYMRRILRIWPLYYWTVLLSFLIVPAEHSATSLVLTLAIFPNLAQALDQEWVSSPQIWSIGVEEQFYLMLPILVRWIPTKKLPKILIAFFVGYTLLPHALGYINARTVQSDSIAVLYSFFYDAKFNCMSVGCLLGYLVATHNNQDSAGGRLLRHLRRKPVAHAAAALAFALWFGKVRFGYFTDEVFSLLFGITILNLATNRALGWNIEREPFKFLGKISYGIYMYHWIVIVLAMRFMPYQSFNNDVVYNIVLYGTVLAATIVLSWFSFVTFETYFLKKKSIFSSDPRP